MPNKPDLRCHGFHALGLAVGLLALACQSRFCAPELRVAQPPPAMLQESAVGAAAIDAAASEGHRGPRLVPVLDRMLPSYVAVEQPGTAALVVDGIRLRLRANGSFDVASGVLPLARDVAVMQLPSRLGGGVLFALSTPDNTWLLRADSFTGSLVPIGKVDIPTRAVTPGFEAIYATVRSTGLVLAIDPKNGNASESTLLPLAPEYGAIAVVDDWFGAYVDPLRGLMTTHDAGQHWQPRVEYTGIPIQALREEAGELAIELSDHRRFWLSRRGDVRAADPADRPSSKKRSIHSWVQRWKMASLGGWPIELAVTRGALQRQDIATVLSHGMLADVRLRDGAILRTRSVDVAPDKTCQALQAEPEVFFLCQNSSATSIHRLTAEGRLERLLERVGQREVASVSSAGLVLRGACSESGPVTKGEYCSIRLGHAPALVRLSQPTGRERLVVGNDGAVAVLLPPSGNKYGRLSYLGRTLTDVRLELPEDCSQRQRSILTEGYWLERPHLEGDVISSWVSFGDDLLGVHIASNGKMTAGEAVSGASRAAITGNHAILPDSSGYARESLDGGLTYLRPQLPIPIAATKGAISKQMQQYGCSLVGCQLGDWLRIGWSDPRRVAKSDALESVSAPDSIRLARRQRKVPRLLCEVEQRVASPFYAARAPPFPAPTLGFDRDWSVASDPNGDGALWTIEDSGKVRAFLVEPGRAVAELTDVAGRKPRRISDVARLIDGWYLLGTRPIARLVVVSAAQTRVVSDFDPRSRLHAARLRMVKNRDKTRVGYLTLSARLRAVDVEWLVYPVNASTGAIEAPIVVPIGRGLRPCDADEDGWLFETSLDLIADVVLHSSQQELSGRAQGLLRLTESGICIDRVLVNGTAPPAGKPPAPGKRGKSDISGSHVDEAGKMRKVSCQILESGAN